jgi:hypothetical protein
MAILDAIKYIQTQMRTVSGIKSAPDYESPGVFPLVLTHLGSGEIIAGDPAGQVKTLDNIIVELHVAESGSRGDAFATLEVLHPGVVGKLVADVTFGGKISTYSGITYSTVATVLDTVPTLARVYTISQCKIIA